MIYGKEKIFRDSADGNMPREEKNFFFALNKLTEDNNNQIALNTVMKETRILIEPKTNVLPEFQQLYETISIVSIKFNHQKIKNYPPYSLIVQILWPLITITVTQFEIYILF